MSIRVAIVEDHPLVAKAIEQELSVQEDIKVVGKADHGSKLMSLVHSTLPDVVILDLGMSTGGFEPVSEVQKLRCQYPEVQILVLTGHDDATWMQQLIEAGVLGYVLKSDSFSLHLAESVRAVYGGRRFYSSAVTEKLLVLNAGELNDKELLVLRHVAEGLSNATIARRMGLAEQTVSNYLTCIYRKLDVADKDVNPRVAAINKARELGILVS